MLRPMSPSRSFGCGFVLASSTLRVSSSRCGPAATASGVQHAVCVVWRSTVGAATAAAAVHSEGRSSTVVWL
eukprot:3772773-Alexandrium_andersonii.AAC.1